MAIALVATARAAGANGGTTAARDTTGATLIVISVSYHYNDPITVSDSKGNNYTALTQRGGGPTLHRIFYTLAPVVGTGHTITVSGTNVYASLVAAAFSGVSSYDQEVGSTGLTPLVAPPVTPALNGALLFTGLSATGATATTPAGYTSLLTVPFAPFYNKVVLRCGPDGQLEINEERHDGDGVRRRWPLNAPFVQQIGGLHLGSDAAGQDPGGFGLGHFGTDDTPWMIDFATNEIVQRADQPILTSDRWLKVWYHAQFPFTVTKWNGETPILEYFEARPDVISIPVAEGIAQALLASFQLDHYQAAAAYLVQTTAASSNPSWAWADGSTGNAGNVAVAVFLPPPPTAPTVTTGSATAVTPSEATLGGTVNPNGLATTARFEWGLTTAYGNTTADQALGSGTSSVAVTAALTGLAANTTYHYRLRATNSAGTTLGTDGVFTTPPPGRWRLTIDGEDQADVVEAVSITWTLNERARMVFIVGDLLPDRYAEVLVYAPDGVTPIFGGLIVQRNFAGRTQVDGKFSVSCECGDWFTYTDWTSTTVTYATAVTLKQVLTDLVDGHLAQYGITLDPAQVTGRTLEPFTWTDKRASDALRELSDRTTYVVAISAAKVLSMSLPGTMTPPFSMTESLTNCRDLTWRDSDRTPYNTVVLRCGPDGQLEINEEKHYGDGVRRRWPLNAPFVLQIGGLHLGSDAAGQDPGGFGLGYYGIDDTPWMIDFATNEIVQRADQPILTVDPTNPANTRWFKVWYHAQFPFTVRVTTGETPVIEYHESRPDVLSIPVAQGIADSLLASFQAAPRELRIATDVDGLQPGQALTIDLPVLRQVSGTFLVTSVGLRIQFDIDGVGRLWRYDIDAIGSDRHQGSYLDAWRQLTGLGFGSSGSVISGDSGAGATTGADEVFVGTDTPIATTVELWYDTDAT